jgi:hypothetical protein
MARDRVMRAALWTSVPYNLAGALGFVAPDALVLIDPPFPRPVPRFYGAQLALMVALFGGAYAWLARRPVIDRPLVTLTMLGKAGFFALVVLFWASGDVGGRGVLLASTPRGVSAAPRLPRRPRGSR